MFMNNTGENIDKRVTEIISELDECREDERISQNQVVQIISTAGTVLGLVFGASFLNKDMLTSNKRALFYLSVIIFVTTFAYLNSLGIINVLRFHYIRDLEDRLALLIPDRVDEKELIHWMSFSSPVTTRNPFHISSAYTFIHFSCYTLATFFAIFFCGAVIAFQYQNLGEYTRFDRTVAIGAIILTLSPAFIYVFISVKSKKMFDFAMENAKVKRDQRIQYEYKYLFIKKLSDKMIKKRTFPLKDMLQAILYFIYPKRKDCQKMFLVTWGFLVGLYLSYGTISLEIIKNHFEELIITLIVIEVLIYQARYQWNDIRGIKGDIEAGKRDRLPVWSMGERAVWISSIIMAIKIAAAFYIMFIADSKLYWPLMISASTIIFLTILYETVKTLKYDTGIFIFVSLGYPIRVFAGIWAAYPQIWQNGIADATIFSWSMIVLLLGAYAFYGAFSVTLPWTYEAIDQEKNEKTTGKSHFKKLFLKVNDRCNTSPEKPLREKGYMTDPWNWTYLMSIILTSSILIFNQYIILRIIYGIIEIALAIKTCLAEHKKIVLYTLCMMTLLIIKIIGGLLTFDKAICYGYIFICFNQFLFAATYFALRYYFDPDFDFIKVCKAYLIKLVILYVGLETWNYLQEQGKKLAK